jgi:hypothetical protein
MISIRVHIKFYVPSTSLPRRKNTCNFCFLSIHLFVKHPLSHTIHPHSHIIIMRLSISLLPGWPPSSSFLHCALFFYISFYSSHTTFIFICLSLTRSLTKHNRPTWLLCGMVSLLGQIISSVSGNSGRSFRVKLLHPTRSLLHFAPLLYYA